MSIICEYMNGLIGGITFYHLESRVRLSFGCTNLEMHIILAELLIIIMLIS